MFAMAAVRRASHTEKKFLSLTIDLFHVHFALKFIKGFITQLLELKKASVEIVSILSELEKEQKTAPPLQSFTLVIVFIIKLLKLITFFMILTSSFVITLGPWTLSW